MFKVLRADRDSYITDKVVRGVRVHSGNVGAAGSLDLFKLYAYTSSGSVPNTELSRLLVHFDLDPLRELVENGRIDTTNPSFTCTLKLFDVYGGQPCPTNFTVVVHPLSRSFDEGLGRDVVYYSDRDACNFLTASRAQGQWLVSGCGMGGGLPGSVDYITASTGIQAGASLEMSQLFVTGEEDLSIDVTTIVSATIAGLLPDEGFRIAFDDSLESDAYSYFVKRFGSRSAFNEDKRPRLTVRFDDSIQDDSQILTLDSPGNVFLYNYAQQAPANLVSASIQVTGSNSLILKMQTAISGGFYTLSFTGSQHTLGSTPVAGVYSASVNLPSTNSVIAAKMIESGSVKFVPIWGSLDGTVPFLTGSSITVRSPMRSSNVRLAKNFFINAIVRDRYLTDEEASIRVNIFDQNSPIVQHVRTPVVMPGLVVRDVHYQIRDASTNVVHVPFDTEKNSTRLSSDAVGMFFKMDTSNLTADRLYVIDILVVTGSDRQVFRSASPTFRVSDLQ